MIPDIKISSVCERDLDLLLLEEFTTSASFLEWFMRRLGVKDSGQLLEASRAVTTTTGESDLELTIQLHGCILKILIENKLDAILQPRQAERYCERAGGYLREAICGKTITVVVAPKAYFPDDDDNLGFDDRVTDEEILQWFQASGELGNRARYKCELLRVAITRSGTRWQLIPDEATTAFWQRYWEVAKDAAPHLHMPRPGQKPAIACFIRFKPRGLPAKVALLHKVSYGNVDLQFARMGEHIDQLEARYGHLLGPNMYIQRAGKSAVIRALVPIIDMHAPFTDSEPTVRQGLAAAVALLEWYRATGTA